MTSVEQKRARGRQPVGEPRNPGTRRSKADQWRPAAGQLAALDAALAEPAMVGMERADLLRRIVAGQAGGSFKTRGGPGLRWSRAISPDPERVTVIWAPGQTAWLDEAARVLSGREGVRVTRNEVVRRLVARWLLARN